MTLKEIEQALRDGVSQKEIAEKSGYSQPTIVKFGQAWGIIPIYEKRGRPRKQFICDECLPLYERLFPDGGGPDICRHKPKKVA